MNTLRISVVFLVIFSMLSGCTTVSRQLGSVTANKYAEPRSGTVWVVPPPQLEPPRPDERTVYISYRNISDATLDVGALLKEAAQNQGWEVVNDPTLAHYRLRTSTRFFGEVEPESGGASMGKGMGAIAGAATGIGVGVATSRATDSGLAGAAAGIGAGGLAGIGISNASKPREWALIMDVVLEERQGQPIEVEVSTGSESASASVSGTGNSRTASGGATTQSNSSSATTTKKTQYFPHGIRLSVWANQMNMQQEEAMPLIRERTQKVVTRMLPM
ncbi:TraT complement resistance protein [Halospina denitrificans]|uniref:TraT complement resistance protein n=1 Tax=Halospina denitrificans TaxID=332522 RepID=A0A4R7JJI0_9GAMM|nr:complement resistance protein TraT [Halospina denitrificans]TDT37083.1 TraT complement resistance protein [Halospina denitrificans]